MKGQRHAMLDDKKLYGKLVIEALLTERTPESG